MLRKLLSTFLFLAIFAPVALAQSGGVTGKVTDSETGEAVPTANVLVVELQRGAATDADGNYTIENIPPGTYTLRVSFVGYKTFTSKVNIQSGQTITQNVQLEPGAVGLDELVVTGYGVTSKRELTGSITKVSSEDFQNVPAQNTESLLQGRAAGVQITTTSGNPGGGFQVRVRGTGSITAGNQPLFIVDGVQISFANQSEQTDESPLNSIKPSDIESIEVLKDAAAAAIYGAQAANGVVLITTKRGQQGATRINASVEFGSRQNIKQYDLLNTPQYMNYQIDSYFNTFPGFFGTRDNAESFVLNAIMPSFGYAAGTPINELRDFDWQDWIIRDGFHQSYTLSASGGDENTRFYISGGWENTGGTFIDNDFERWNLRTNFDHQFSSQLTGKVNFNITNSLFNAVCQDGPFINCPISQASFEPPFTFPFLDNGDYNPNTRFGRDDNPAVVEQEVDRFADNLSILGNISATYNFNDWLSLTSLAGLDYRQVRDVRFETPIAQPAISGRVNEGIATTINFNLNTVLNFRQTFQEVHNVSGLVGGEYRRDFTREVETTGNGLPNGLFRSISSTATPAFAQGFDSEFRIASYFGQVKYNYNEKYFASVVARYDGSSRFGEDNRWGFFPSFSAGWRISEEDFFPWEAFEELKLRASYGVTGNSEIGNFAARGLFGVGGSYNGVSALGPSQLANVNLGWEEAKEINVGLDWSLWRGRFSGSLDFYQRDNEDLLLSRPLPSDSGFGSITENVGEVRNKGVEFEFETVNIDRGGFLWTTRFNIAVQTNEVRQLTGGQQFLDLGDDDPVAVGHSLQAFHVPIWAGVNPADGRPMWFDQNGEITYDPDVDDRRFFDGAEEDAVGGFGNRFSYKGVSLDVFFQYSYGQTAFPAQEWFFMQTPIFFTNVWDDVQRRWQQPGDITDIPQVLRTNHRASADWRVVDNSAAYFDASYIRLKNVTLSYNLPADLVRKINVRGIRVYASGLNLMTWTSWPGQDPEVAGTFTQASYPSALQINGGIEVQF